MDFESKKTKLFYLMTTKQISTLTFITYSCYLDTDKHDEELKELFETHNLED